ncbi:GNAT family N-acetyltransferase [Deinococcus puniceus]|uniref:Acetyltransferase n=1 Tax=Deinococcus puniceus TaxID=1182568 RepID=A0A172TCB6_9DEIO|nr:GNAT family N-acetyltransferase [Deinococcus puniceus]ANE44557.1 acetyltransferase [Deinococcus puniceus]
MSAHPLNHSPISYRVRAELALADLGKLREAAWGGQDDGSWWKPVLERSLTWVTAHDGAALVGFVNVAWDGGVHAFLLDTTVHPNWQRRGIGTQLVRRAAEAARTGATQIGQVEWLHVDFEPYLSEFYAGCGFQSTAAGLLRLK